MDFHAFFNFYSQASVIYENLDKLSKIHFFLVCLYLFKNVENHIIEHKMKFI